MEYLTTRHSKLKRAVATGMAGVAVALAPATAEAEPANPSHAEIMEFPDSLQQAWQDIISTRSGTVDIALYDRTTGETISYDGTNEQFKTASIVKMSILARILMLDQAAGHGMTPDQLANATPMMTASDNDTASALWNEAGGAAGMQDSFRQFHADATVAGSGGYWGATLTTPEDQLKVVNEIAYPGNLLTPESAAIESDLMRRVVPEQRWGVNGGVPEDVSVALKNGWYPHDSGWTINSVGHINGLGVNYTIAALTKDNPSMQYGVETIELLAAASWKSLNRSHIK